MAEEKAAMEKKRFVKKLANEKVIYEVKRLEAQAKVKKMEELKLQKDSKGEGF